MANRSPGEWALHEAREVQSVQVSHDIFRDKRSLTINTSRRRIHDVIRSFPPERVVAEHQNGPTSHISFSTRLLYRYCSKLKRTIAMPHPGRHGKQPEETAGSAARDRLSNANARLSVDALRLELSAANARAGPSVPRRTIAHCDPIRFKHLPSYRTGLSSKISSSSLASTVRSIPVTCSESDEETDQDYHSVIGGRSIVRDLEDLQHWALAKPVNGLRKDSDVPYSHLPDWSLLPGPFTPTDSRSFPMPGYCPSDLPLEMGRASDHNTHTESAHTSQAGLLTSYPRSTVLRQDMENDLLSLLDFHRFEQMLSKPATRLAFRQWLARNSAPDATQNNCTNLYIKRLDQWTDESLVNQLSKELRERTQELLHAYYDCDRHGTSSTRSRTDAINIIATKEAMQLASTTEVLRESRRWLIESLYTETFRQFVTHKLVDVTKLKLRSNLDDRAYSGLGDSFCLTNPRFKDNPIVIVSPGFAVTTGYDSSLIIGRNCRFLQGPGTNPQSIQRLRNALKNGEACVELLLNYRSDGTPFYCLLSILPLFDDKGSLTYYIGGQVNVTQDLQTNELACLMAHSGFSDSAENYMTSADFINPPMTITACPTHNPTLKGSSLPSSMTRSVGSSSIDLQSSAGSFPKIKTSNPIAWLTSKVKREKLNPEINFKDFEHRNGLALKNFEDNIMTFQSEYSQLILFKRHSRRIVFATPEALNFLGLPTRTLSETYSSALLQTDFLDLLKAIGGSRVKQDLRHSLTKVISSRRAASFSCNMHWAYTQKSSPPFILHRNKKVHINTPSVVHLTPLIDGSGACTSYVAILS